MDRLLQREHLLFPHITAQDPRKRPVKARVHFSGAGRSVGCDGAAIGADHAFRVLPEEWRPDFKILCGDQVYLDSPWKHYLWHTHGEADLERRFFDIYWRTWAGDRRKRGLRSLLADGANYYSPDDHELWNNAPNRANRLPGMGFLL